MSEPQPPSASDSLEQVLGRALGLGGAPPPLGREGSAAAGPPRRPDIRPRRRAGRAGRGRRAVAGAVVCAALAVALGAVVVLDRPAAFAPGPEVAEAPDRSDGSAASAASAAAADADAAGPRSMPPGAPLAERLPGDVARVCRPATALDPDAVEGVVCSPGAPVIRLEYLRYEDPAISTARFAAAVTGLPRPSGPPVCANGGAEHRSWSRPEAPDEKVGEYACRVDDDTVSIVWTVGGDLVARADADASDAAALYAWWRSSDAAL